MFGFFKSKATSKLKVMGHDVEVVSVIRNGKVLFTGDTARTYPKTHLEGQIMEVMLRTRFGNPYFAYYLCPAYYHAVVFPAGAAAFGGPAVTERFRTAVSQQAGAFVAQFIRQNPQLDARSDITSFRHNRAHTNVLAFVPTLSEWYPIQHSDAEDDDASERKVAEIVSGRLRITQAVAVDSISPSA